MAKIVPLDGEKSGSVAALTFSRNAYGAYVRQRVTPTNPNTPKQTVVRGQLASIVSTWRGFTPVVQAAWQAFADAQPPTIGRLGVPYQLTGQDWHRRINLRYLQAGFGLWNVAPAQWIGQVVTDCVFSLTYPGGGAPGVVTLVQTNFDGAPAATVPAFHFLQVWASPLQAYAAQRPKTLKLIKHIQAAGSCQNVDISSEYAAVYGAIADASTGCITGALRAVHRETVLNHHHSHDLVEDLFFDPAIP